MSEPMKIRPSLQEQFPNRPDQEPLDETLIPSAEEMFTAASKRDKSDTPSDIERALAAPNHIDLTPTEMTEILTGIRREIILLEEAARSQNKWSLPPETANRISLIVRFSAPGTYYRPEKPPEQPDRYAGIPWAKNMDRNANDIAARFGIVVSGQKTGQDFSKFGRDEMLMENSELGRFKQTTRDAIHSASVKFVYIGRPDEAQAVAGVLKTKSSFIPENSVSILTGNHIDNTLDQVAALKNYFSKNTFPEGSIITIVDFAPRLVRISRKIQFARAIPSNLEATLFPIATPNIENSQLPLFEAKGTLSYIIRNQAATETNPLLVFGALNS